MSSEPATKKSKTSAEYTLLYHPGIPGRGEYIRLAFEAAGVPFSDPLNESKSNASQLYRLLGDDATLDSEGNPPPFAPPALRVSGAGRNGGDLLIYQTPNILLYLGPKLGLAGADPEIDQYYVNELALTALDLCNETHDTHHPIAVMDYYEDQKPEALKKSRDFRANRIPKFVGYFEKILKGNEELGKGRYLVGDRLTYADTTLWHVLDGLFFAFPREMEARKGEFPGVLETFYESFKGEENVKKYLEGGRRLEFSMGLFRKYPELDRLEVRVAIAPTYYRECPVRKHYQFVGIVTSKTDSSKLFAMMTKNSYDRRSSCACGSSPQDWQNRNPERERGIVNPAP